ncbi:bile acid:sodium symporter family protein [Dasania sp. GY-MA-18]|uniref:Bile acid:sodium symporter family protein n=1 Tax=Dasania phycosphaerae TaxID=2950436 RepID=A0A9J6RHY0_9GAMM|nr:MULTISPECIES: bile acid:sodium symporter family protein [Dasania]MCR8921542.1 bile acid:sodium symporter family protein [Dasania sp. GY-MA-18]MCZ0863970.1 bile acid:sodium symporter family protein [Dasania phycosphaerae]MCZ0867698.1 bile acid:sodium symporter family protein [Dasania phycosphaerae]
MIKYFPLWAPLAAVAGYLAPDSLTPLKVTIIPLLMLVMLCMGMTLRPADFIAIKRYRSALAAGLLLQFSVMPLLALACAKIFQLDSDLSLGLLLVGSVAGGTASNVMTYLAKGHVALSVSMTACSTLLSVVMTPLLLTLFSGTHIDIPALAILNSLIKIIILPVSLGLLLNAYCHRHVKKIEPALAPLAALTILLIIAIVVALNQPRVATLGLAIVFASLLHNISGLLLGYAAAYGLGFNSKICRTIALEVGMQNSGLATALALKFFNQAVALPGALFSIWINMSGAIFAALCVHRDQQSSPAKD